MLPTLKREQVEELLTAANGNPVSYIDSPEWCFGDRRNTFSMRDGLPYIGAPKIGDAPEQVCGSMSSLAYSCGDKCREYQDALRWINRTKLELEDLRARYLKTKSVKRKREFSELINRGERDIRNSKEKLEGLRARYFRGFEMRFLIG